MKKAIIFGIVSLILVFIIGCANQVAIQQKSEETPAISQEPLSQAEPSEKIEQPQQNQSQQMPFVERKPNPEKCPDGIWDEAEQKDPTLCPEDYGKPKGPPMGIQPGQKQQFPSPQQFIQPEEEVSIAAVDSQYNTISSKPTGWFTTGQDADIMLAGIDFNNAGGPLLFNHPGNVASDGTHLLLADRNNNRILIWDKAPSNNTPPDLVLGQPDFISNNPGKGLNQLNWPVSVAAAKGKVVVADTYNDRILIWNSFPTKNGQAADIEIKDIGSGRPAQGDTATAKRHIGWPWAVWTNGEKLIVASTGTSSVLIWNTFPIKNNQAADIVLFAGGNFGTPRSIGSDENHLMIGDHNAKPNNGGAGNFFWKSFPTKDDEPYDFFVFTPQRMGEKIPLQEGLGQLVQGDVMWGGTFTPDGKFVVISNRLYIWNSFPENENDAADLIVGGGEDKKEGYSLVGGDGSGTTFAGGKLYIGQYNGNKIVAFNTLPTKVEQNPDFAIGAPNISVNTLTTNYFANNPAPLTDGKSLLVLSNYDHIMYAWKNLPDQSGAKPDFVYKFSPPPQQASIVRNSLVIANGKKMFVWKKLPLNGENPDITFDGKIGGIDLAKINCIAGDDKYFYISTQENKTYVWEDVPTEDTMPKITINTAVGGGGGAAGRGGGGCYSDGIYITSVSTFEHRVKIYRIADLISSPENPPQPMTVGRTGGMFNLPEGALVYNNHLFVADTVSNRVLVWNNVEDAINEKDPDIILGAGSLTEKLPEIGKDKLFWPSTLAFDGSYLWVGEFKFSGRILRFSVH